jgi:hypothetical protein
MTRSDESDDGDDAQRSWVVVKDLLLFSRDWKEKLVVLAMIIDIIRIPKHICDVLQTAILS